MRQSSTAWTRVGSAARALAAKPAIVVGAIVLAAAAITGYFSRQIIGYEPDEVGYTRLALALWHAASPITLSHGGSQRINQLYPLLIAPFWGSLGSISAFRAVHILNVIVMASTAIPAYLLAREVVDRRWCAYVVAALTVATPWMTLSLAEFTEVAAFPACTWALLAMQRALVLPSVRRDAIALVAIAFACYGRLQLIVLAPVLILAMLVHEFGFALSISGPRRASLREALRRIVRRHALLAALIAGGVVIGLPLLLSGALASLFGFYGNTLSGATFNSSTFGLAHSYLTFVGVGLAAVPAALAIGFVVVSLLAPESRRTHAFAALTFVAVVALTLQVAEISVRFEEGVLQERYLFYIAPLLTVGMCGALLARRGRPAMVIGGSAAFALLLATVSYPAVHSAFWYQVSPAMTGFYGWVLPKFGAANALTSDPASSTPVLAGLIVLAAGVVIAALSRGARGPRALAVVGGLAILLCGAQTLNALSKVVHGSPAGKGFGTGALTNVNWVDRAVEPGASVAQVVANVGGLDRSRSLWEDSEFWNHSIVAAYTMGGAIDSYFASPRLTVDQRSGAVELERRGGSTSAAPTERYAIAPARGFPLAFVGVEVAHSSDGTLQLIKLANPPAAAWVMSGASSNGWLELDRPATLRLFMLDEPHHRCARVELTLGLPALSYSPRRLVVLRPGVRRSLRFAAGQVRTISEVLCRTGGATPELQLLDEQSAAAIDSQLTLQLRKVSVTPI